MCGLVGVVSDNDIDSNNSEKIRSLINSMENGYLKPLQVKELLLAAEVPIVPEAVCQTKENCIKTVYF